MQIVSFSQPLFFMFQSVTKAPAKSRSMLFKSPAHAGVPFVPKVTSTTNMNLNFSNMKTPGTVPAKTPKTVTLVDAPKRTPQPSSASKENKRKSVMNTAEKRKSGIENRKSLGNTVEKRKSGGDALKSGSKLHFSSLFILCP